MLLIEDARYSPPSSRRPLNDVIMIPLSCGKWSTRYPNENFCDYANTLIYNTVCIYIYWCYYACVPVLKKTIISKTNGKSNSVFSFNLLSPSSSQLSHKAEIKGIENSYKKHDVRDTKGNTTSLYDAANSVCREGSGFMLQLLVEVVE
jgi:hypothetical protein